MKKVWAFDIDGCVADTYPLLHSIVEKKYGICWFQMPYYPNRLFSNIRKKDFYFELNSLFENCKIPPIKKAIEVINEYYKKHKRIVFITHRKPELYFYTMMWLNKYFDFNYELYQGYFDKVDIAIKNNIIGIIDDKPSICKNFLNSNLKAICHEQPYHKYENLTNLKVMNWEQIEKEIL